MGSPIIALTANPDSSLGKTADTTIKVVEGEGSKKGGSYLGRQVVRPETPTMGDESEEMSLFSLYLMVKKLDDPEVKIQQAAEKEIRQFKSLLKENHSTYSTIRKTLYNYRQTGIYFIGKGKSEIVCKMISNRAQHYGFEVYSVGNSTNPPIRFHNLGVVISGSGAAGGLLTRIINRIKDEGVKVGKQKNRPGIVSVIGNKAGVHEHSDIFLKLNGANPCGIATIDELGGPEPFYFRTPVTFNMMFREIAEQLGILEIFARLRHVNF